ncbi:Uncharacterised protein [Helicobacter mustelae]|nr:Uncharacterised protein [Helicobacter mustelae]
MRNLESKHLQKILAYLLLKKYIYGYQFSARILRFKTYAKDSTPPLIAIALLHSVI